MPRVDNVQSTEFDKAEILAYHGWGYSSDAWQGWRSWLQQQRCQLNAFDRGYFGWPMQPAFRASTKAKLIFVHSYGLHFCPAEAIKQADLLVIFSSFRQFHPAQASRKKRSQQSLQQMMIQFEHQPHTVLQNFRLKCAQPARWSEPLLDSINAGLLAQDLNQLHTCWLNLLPLQQVPRIVVLHGTQDRIVPAATGKALAASLDALYFEIAATGHALPFAQVETCQTILQPILKPILERRHES